MLQVGRNGFLSVLNKAKMKVALFSNTAEFRV